MSHGLVWAMPFESTSLFSFDFTSLTLGKYSDAAFLAATGLVFERSTTSTVQTSASALDSTPGVDEACIGNAGYGQGLVIQHNTYNIFGTSGSNAPRDLTVNWIGGTAAATGAYAAGPDGIAPGVGCSRSNGASGQFSNYASYISSARRCFSSWQRSKDAGVNGDMQMIWMDTSGTPTADAIQATRAASNTWARLSLANGTATRQYLAVADGRDYTASGGDTARARDILADYIQLEEGDFATEAIPFSQTRRACDLVSYATGTDLIDAGQLRFYAKFIPKCASTHEVYYNGTGGSGTSDYNYLLAWGGGAEYVALYRPGPNNLFASINGDSVSSDAMTWALGDTVEVYIELGAGLTSKMFYRVNEASWVDLNAFGTITGDVAPPGAVQIFAVDATPTADSGQFPCWLQRIEFGGVDPTV